jgi:omega-6 fatty acid desaturase (delta-12 desaturase)
MLNKTPAISEDSLSLESRKFQTPILASSLSQLASSFGGFVATCAAIYATITIFPWLVLPLSVVAAGFVVRIFIIQHDCGHGSFFPSRRANHLTGLICSLITLTPYSFWRRQHARHHGSWNNLDQRAASGLDIYSSCMTVDEYRALGPFRRILVRFTYHPVISNLMLPPFIFVFLYRIPFDVNRGWRRERRAVYLTNISLIAAFGGLGFALGYGRVVIVQLSIMLLASIIGVWLFSVQHRFEHAYWTSDDDWDLTTASLKSTSYLHLPRLLQWFTGNIGFHHVHHINPRIPNYRLEEFHNANERLQSATRLNFRKALCALRYVLWNEDQRRLVSVRSVASH